MVVALRNSFFMLFVLLLCVSDAYSMLCLGKKLPYSFYHAGLAHGKQKKNGMRPMSGGEIVGGLMLLPGACVFLGVPLLAGCVIAGGAALVVGGGALTIGGVCISPLLFTANIMKDMCYRKAAYAVALNHDQCLQGYTAQSNRCTDNPLCCKNTYNNATRVIDQLAKFDNDEDWRLNYMSNLNTYYDKLNYVELAEIDKFNYDARHKNIDLEKYRNTFGIIGQKKQCIYTMMCILKNDMPRYQQKLEQLYSNRLGLAFLTYELKDDVNKKIKKLNDIIVKIQKEHYSLRKMPPMFKVNDSSLVLFKNNALNQDGARE
jgi:hypothetical protein